MITLKKTLLPGLAVLLVTGCASGPGPVDPVTGMTRSERNLCEQMRSFRPYYPDECSRKAFTHAAPGTPVQ